MPHLGNGTTSYYFVKYIYPCIANHHYLILYNKISYLHVCSLLEFSLAILEAYINRNMFLGNLNYKSNTHKRQIGKEIEKKTKFGNTVKR